MEYKEEQANEIEALESIYYGDLEILSTEPYHKFSIPIKSDEYTPGTEEGLACNLVFTYTQNYPDEAPNMEIENAVNFDESYSKELLGHLNKEVTDNLGMVMIFSLVSTAQECLNVKWDKFMLEEAEAALKKQQEEEEAELKRFEGTKVTVESFLKWKLKFEDETGIAKKREMIEKEGKKLTGRELFLTDITLNESDLQFLDEGESVKVDESLFQDLDDLDLDDEDFDPDNSNSDNC